MYISKKTNKYIYMYIYIYTYICIYIYIYIFNKVIKMAIAFRPALDRRHRHKAIVEMGRMGALDCLHDFSIYVLRFLLCFC